MGTLFLDLVGEAAAKLGDGPLPPEMLLQPLLDDEVAGPVLADAGVTASMVESLLEEMRGESDGDDRSYEPNPGWWEMEGFARGFAAATGQSLQPVHALIAQLWTRHMWLVRDVEPEAVRESLVAHGVAIPARPLPRAFRGGERVFVTHDELEAVLANIDPHLPPGSEVPFNYEDERGWIQVTEGIDLEPLVRRVLAEYAG